MSIGGFTEKIFPMLDDIKRVEVVRGAGAAVWGPGAISGVINIITFDGAEVVGTKATIKAGAFEKFQSLEIRNGQNLGNGKSLLFYVGLANYDGASTEYSPIISGQDVNYENIQVTAGGEVNPSINNIPNYYSTFDDNLLLKANIRYKNKSFDSWLRFTSGGIKSAPRRGKESDSNNWNNATAGSYRENGYAQLTWFNEYKPDSGYFKNTTLSLSFDKTEFAKTQQAYESAVKPLFTTLDTLDKHLENRNYLVGNQLTEADIRLIPTLLRFDSVYYIHFKCSQKRIVDYPNLSRYMNALHQLPAVKNTTKIEHIMRHYYYSHEGINPHRIIPLAPVNE